MPRDKCRGKSRLVVQANSCRKSVGSEDDHGVDSGSSRGDDVAGHEGDGDHQDWEPDEGDQVVRANPAEPSSVGSASGPIPRFQEILRRANYID